MYKRMIILKECCHNSKPGLKVKDTEETPT